MTVPLPHVLVGDLLALAGELHDQDRRVERHNGCGWSRRLEVRVAVSDPQRWERTVPLLREMVALAGGDQLQVSFTQAEVPGPPLPKLPAVPPGGVVVLFSGGMDSLAGVVRAMQGGRPVLLLRLGAAGAVDARRLLPLLPAGLSEPNFAVVRVGSRLRSVESTHRLRSLAYLLVAAGLTTSQGQGELWVCENGTMTYHLPISPARASTLSSRSTHPVLLRQVERLLLEVGGEAGAVRLHNPLSAMTRGEVARELLAVGQEAALRASRTCQRPAATGSQPCGVCIPCLHRALALAWAQPGLREVVRVPALGCYPDLTPEGRRNVEHLLRWIAVWEGGAPALPEHDAGLGWVLSSGLTDEEVGEALGVSRRFARQSAEVIRAGYPALAARFFR